MWRSEKQLSRIKYRSSDSYINFLAKEQTDEYSTTHRRRYALTLKFAIDNGVINADSRVLELTPKNAFTHLIEHVFTGIKVKNTEYELRKPFPEPSNYYDCLFHMEVIEHLKDIETDENFHKFDKSGVMDNLKACYEVLKPGGHIIMTTPNANGYRTLVNVLEYRHPFMYSPHPRELSITDVRDYLTEAGFEVKKIETINSWSETDSFKHLDEMLRAYNYSTNDRHDNMFVIAMKPNLPNYKGIDSQANNILKYNNLQVHSGQNRCSLNKMTYAHKQIPYNFCVLHADAMQPNFKDESMFETHVHDGESHRVIAPAEDMRLVKCGDDLWGFYTIPNHNGGVWKMCMVNIRKNAEPQTCQSSSFSFKKVEKNWTPFTWNNTLFAMYSINPQIILEISDDAVCAVRYSNNKSTYPVPISGGTPAIHISHMGEEYLICCGHFYRSLVEWPYRKYFHVFCKLQAEPPFNVIQISDSFVFPTHYNDARDNIQFATGMYQQDSDTLVISYGVADCISVEIETSFQKCFELFEEPSLKVSIEK